MNVESMRKIWIILDNDVLEKLAVVKVRTRIPQYQIINRIIKNMSVDEIIEVIKNGK